MTPSRRELRHVAARARSIGEAGDAMLGHGALHAGRGAVALRGVGKRELVAARAHAVTRETRVALDPMRRAPALADDDGREHHARSGGVVAGDAGDTERGRRALGRMAVATELRRLELERALE